MALDAAKTDGRDGHGARPSRELRLDVLVDGEPVQRSVSVTCSADGIHLAGERIDLDSVFWVSRRAGLVLVFARDRTLAFLGRSGDLEELARAVERGSDRATQRSLLQPLAAEVVVCTAGTAVSGHIGEVAIKGLHLAVFTQQGLHLFARDRTHTLRWPVERVSEITSSHRETGRSGLKLTAADSSVTLRYLFPEEIHAVARVARRSPTPMRRAERSLELFAQGEVAPPPPAKLPEFSAAANRLEAACTDASERVVVDASLGPRFDRGYFERHFKELGEIALGPLMMRRSAALGADSLLRAVEALDADQLREEAVGAFRGVEVRLFEVYDAEVAALRTVKRLTNGGGDLSGAETARSSLSSSLATRIESLEPSFAKVLARQHMLLQQLQAREHAPPETEVSGVDEAEKDWQTEISKLDDAYGTAWGEVLTEVADIWSDEFIPVLKDLTAQPTRRLSEGARLAILATITFLIVGALAWWLS